MDPLQQQAKYSHIDIERRGADAIQWHASNTVPLPATSYDLATVDASTEASNPNIRV